MQALASGRRTKNNCAMIVYNAYPAVWRFLTAAVFHMGALHIGFNMLAFVPIGVPSGTQT